MFTRPRAKRVRVFICAADAQNRGAIVTKPRNRNTRSTSKAPLHNRNLTTGGRCGPGSGAQPLPKDQREAVAKFTKGDIGRCGLERCIAVLLREGMDLSVLRQFEGLTRTRLRDTVESIMVRVRMELQTPRNTDELIELRGRETAPLIDWQAVDAGGVA